MVIAAFRLMAVFEVLTAQPSDTERLLGARAVRLAALD